MPSPAPTPWEAFDTTSPDPALVQHLTPDSGWPAVDFTPENLPGRAVYKVSAPRIPRDRSPLSPWARGLALMAFTVIGSTAVLIVILCVKRLCCSA